MPVSYSHQAGIVARTAGSERGGLISFDKEYKPDDLQLLITMCQISIVVGFSGFWQYGIPRYAL